MEVIIKWSLMWTRNSSGEHSRWWVIAGAGIFWYVVRLKTMSMSSVRAFHCRWANECLWSWLRCDPSRSWYGFAGLGQNLWRCGRWKTLTKVLLKKTRLDSFTRGSVPWSRLRRSWCFCIVCLDLEWLTWLVIGLQSNQFGYVLKSFSVWSLVHVSDLLSG